MTRGAKSFVSKNMHQFTDELLTEQPLVGKKVLFAEDQEHLRTIIGMMIEELGADVLPVEDGKNVIEEYSADISGIDLLTLIKKEQRLKDIPVVILTGSNEDQDIQKCYDLGASSYLVKPISNGALMLVVEKLFDQ